MTRKQEIETYLKNKNYQDYIRTLEDMCKDPKSKILIDDAFGGGDLDNLKLKFSEKILGVQRLIPTQNEIGLESLLKHSLTSTKNIDKFFSDKPITINFPLVTFNNNYIVDGHHRWSEALIFNPDIKMICLDYSADISPISMLKITQGAIASSMGEITISKRKCKDLYECSEREIQKYIYDNISPDVIKELIVNVFALNNKLDVVDYLTENCLSLINNNIPIKYAPNRDIMPQVTKSGDEKESGSALNNMKDEKMMKV